MGTSEPVIKTVYIPLKTDRPIKQPVKIPAQPAPEKVPA